MTNVVNIYLRDMKKIFTNIIALIVILAVIILPALYAWFNIGASWDPYSNTNGIKVVVVNDDKGALFNNKTYKIGDIIVDNLKKNKDIGWQFSSKKEAEKGVKEGKYYASIVIPADFSEKALSITKDKIEEPTLIYTVNEKSNAIAPKITSKGVTSIQEQISSKIVETVDGIIFKALNTVGIEIKDLEPDIRKVIDKLYEINDKMPEIYNLLLKANEGVNKTEEVVTNVNNLIPTIDDTINKAKDLLIKFKGDLQKGNEAFKNISPTIKNDLTAINAITDNINNTLSGIDIANSIENISNILNKINGQLSDLSTSVNNVNNFISNINKLVNNPALTDLSNKLTNVSSLINTSTQVINTAISDMQANKQVSIEKFNSIKDVANNINTLITDLNSRFDSEIAPAIESAINSLQDISNNSLNIINGLENTMPDVKDILSLINSGANLGTEKLAQIINEFPNIQAKLGELVNKIKSFDNDEMINGLLDLLIGNWQSRSSYLASPIQVESKSVFPVPNYGSGMNPFFTTLSLWVGGLLLVSLLTTSAYEFEGEKENTIKPLEEYFGKYLTFITIGIFQGLITTIGDILILGVYVVHPALFILYGVIISIVFVTIIYTLVSLFGNIGKSIAVILLVLQVAASGGTFPVEVMPKFFQKIHPFLPFKYGIGAMREVTAGIEKRLIIRNSLFLLIYFISFILLGILLKSFANKKLVKFNEKVEESGLLGH